jgi:alkanesulfonate monooxygenase SsuD/methylene tetrahydromethanopterin reductase-like flavin-dependent oxidoreductase (luciferase family)
MQNEIMKLFSRTLSLLSRGAVTLCVMFLAHRALEVSDARLYRPGVQKPHPEIWFGGSSNAGHHVAAE